MPSVPSAPSSPPRETSTGRLDSWKEIAAYLGRGERTAKRWESERSLPIHRLPGGGRGSVYAFTNELDEWLTSARALREDDGEGLPNESLPLSAEEEPASSAPAPLPIQNDPQPAIVSPAISSIAVPAHVVPAHTGRWRIPAFVALAAAMALLVVLLVNLRSIRAHAALLFHPRTAPAFVPSAAEKEAARQLYLSGRYEWDKRTPDSLNRALDDFTQAVVHDPTNPRIYVGLADTYDMLREYSLMPDAEAYSRALAASRKAIELDDSLAEAHRSLAFAEFWGNWDFQTGEKEFRRAIALNPRDPVAHRWFANAFAAPGWYPLCLREMDRAQELDPASAVTLADKGNMLFNAGLTQQALDLLRQVESTDPQLLSPHFYLSNAYFVLRDYPNFLAESQKGAELKRDPILQEVVTAARQGFHRNGEKGLLQALYNVQKKYFNEGKYPGVYLARTAVRMGKKAEAFQLLRDDFQKHRSELLAFLSDPILAALRDEPEYRKLIEDLHWPTPAPAVGEFATPDSSLASLSATDSGKK